MSVADVDGDGFLDVIALSTTPAQLVWYKNPDWSPYTITSMSERNIDVAPHDVDGDGDPDVALASEFSLGDSLHGGLIQWLECPPDPASQTDWLAHEVDRVPTAHRVRWADITGDGKSELLNLPIVGIGAKPPEYDVAVQFKAYCVPDNVKTDLWTCLLIDHSLHMAHGIAVVDWNGSGPVEMLTASFEGVYLHSRDTGATGWRNSHIGSGNRGERPRQGSSEVGMGWLASADCRFVATIEPWHGNEVVVYTPGPQKDGLWLRRVIDDRFNDGHALACADFDSDGNDEIVAGHRGPDHSLYVYRYVNDEDRWERVAVDQGGMAAAGVFLADLNLDGATDIVAIGTATNNVVWYENKSASRESTAAPGQG